MTAYTSGEWRLNAGNETEIMAGKRNVARAHCGGMNGIGLIEAEANARLIVAAPDLLNAAQAMADSFADCVKTELALSEFPALAALVAAIAKAKGQ